VEVDKIAIRGDEDANGLGANLEELAAAFGRPKRHRYDTLADVKRISIAASR
jgi:hypothetical protein